MEGQRDGGWIDIIAITTEAKCQHRGLMVGFGDTGERMTRALAKAGCVDRWSLDQNSVRYRNVTRVYIRVVGLRGPQQHIGV